MVASRDGASLDTYLPSTMQSIGNLGKEIDARFAVSLRVNVESYFWSEESPLPMGYGLWSALGREVIVRAVSVETSQCFDAHSEIVSIILMY